MSAWGSLLICSGLWGKATNSNEKDDVFDLQEICIKEGVWSIKKSWFRPRLKYSWWMSLSLGCTFLAVIPWRFQSSTNDNPYFFSSFLEVRVVIYHSSFLFSLFWCRWCMLVAICFMRLMTKVVTSGHYTQVGSLAWCLFWVKFPTYNHDIEHISNVQDQESYPGKYVITLSVLPS